MKIYALALVFAACSVGMYAQTTETALKRLPVYFGCSCPDRVAGQVATAFRDRLASSPRYVEAFDAKSDSVFHVELVSGDPSDSQDHLHTVSSVVVTLGPTYLLSQNVFVCGAEKVDVCASDLMAFLDRTLHPN